MKPLFSKSLTLFIALLSLLTACKKDMNQPTNPSNPVEPNNPGLFRFVANPVLTGHPYHASNLHAVVTVAKPGGQEVLSEKLLTLNLDGSVKSEALQLPAGNYQLTRFRLVYGSVQTHFATPVANSAKASQVQKPLAFAFAVEANKTIEVPVEVLRVQQTDRPEDYGYPAGAFDNGQANANPYMKLKLKGIMQIGDILYDSIPSSLAITTWKANGEMSTSYVALQPGVNEVPVLKAALKYEFAMQKWGTNSTMTIDRANANEGTVYVLGGNKQAKKLKSEITYRQSNGTYLSESKTDYFYNAAGDLSKIEYYLRRQDNSPYLAYTETFDYTGNLLKAISKHDHIDNRMVTTTTFTHNPQGKIVAMRQTDNGFETHANVEYSYNPRHEIKVHYQYPSRTYDMNYYMTFTAGNLSTSSAVTSHHNSELGTYNYDLNINPYAHMKWPNLFLSNSSKNNVTSQQKSYHGNYPTNELFSLNYTYDNDGYPKEVLKNFRSYPSGSYAFTTKTVYIY